MKKGNYFASAFIVISFAIASSVSGTMRWRKLSFFPVKGFDETVKWGSQDVSCYEYAGYTVLEKQNSDKPSIFVKSPVKCMDLKDDNLTQPEIFQFQGEHAYFLGMHGNLMFVDQSATPESRSLKIFNVSTKKQVYEGSYFQPMVLDNGTLKLWVKSNEEATRDNCQDYGLRPKMMIETLSSLNLDTFKLSATKKTRCEPRE